MQRPAVVVRSYDNPLLPEALTRLRGIAAAGPVCVVTLERERIFDTPAAVEALALPGVSVRKLPRPGWSLGLNRGLEALSPDERLVLVLSPGVALEASHLEAMIEAASDERASCSFARFEGRHEGCYAGPRNTLCLWRREVFEQVGTFDESLDQQGGMEDYDLALRAFAERGLLPVAAAEGVPLTQRRGVEVEAKIRREEEALERLRARFHRETIEAFERARRAPVARRAGALVAPG